MRRYHRLTTLLFWKLAVTCILVLVQWRRLRLARRAQLLQLQELHREANLLARNEASRTKKRFKRRKKKRNHFENCPWLLVESELLERARTVSSYDESDESEEAQTVRRWFVLAHEDWRSHFRILPFPLYSTAAHSNRAVQQRVGDEAQSAGMGFTRFLLR